MKYIANYPNEKQWKEEWKQEYKYGVILFTPPEPTYTIVNKLRKKYDPKSFANCVAHISLTMPLKQPLTENHIHNIEENLKTIKPFQVTYGPVINFVPVAPGIVFKVNEQKSFEALYKQIEATQGISFYPRKWPFKAHLTIAEFLDDETTEELTTKLNNSLDKDVLYGKFTCKNVTYMVPDQNFCFREIVSIGLG